MSNTPRTDEQSWDITEGRFRDEYTNVVKSEFAKELEVENQVMRDLLKEIASIVGSDDYGFHGSHEQIWDIRKILHERKSLFTNSSNINDTKSFPLV